MTVQCKISVTLGLGAAKKTVEIAGDCEEIRKKLVELISLEKAIIGGEVKSILEILQGGVRYGRKFVAVISWIKRMPKRIAKLISGAGT
ncbi:MAG: hypothetical protein QW434_09535 [Pyrobaculum sp.]